jgi:hypothetical protein
MGGAWNGKLIWGRLTHSRMIGILANPTYAGTYVFGRFQSCKQVSHGEICTVARHNPRPPPGLYHLRTVHHEPTPKFPKSLSSRHFQRNSGRRGTTPWRTASTSADFRQLRRLGWLRLSRTGWQSEMGLAKDGRRVGRGIGTDEPVLVGRAHARLAQLIEFA